MTSPPARPTTHGMPIHLHRAPQPGPTPAGIISGARAASQKRALRVKINGVLYASIKDASIGEGCSCETIKRRIEKGDGEYR